jgi:hypothetical protein
MYAADKATWATQGKSISNKICFYDYLCLLCVGSIEYYVGTTYYNKFHITDHLKHRAMEGLFLSTELLLISRSKYFNI